MDPGLVETHLRTYLQHQPGVEYVSNAVVRTYPDGLDVEVFSASSLREANRRATTTYDREHVTPWIQRHAKQIPVAQEPNLSELRWMTDICLETGRPRSEEGRLFGAAVNTAVRICNAARPGRIVASAAVRDEARGFTSQFHPLGEGTLKGVRQPVALFQVEWRAGDDAKGTP